MGLADLRPADNEAPVWCRRNRPVDCLVQQVVRESVLPSVRASLADGADRDAQAIWFGVAPCADTLLGVDLAEASVVREVGDDNEVTELRASASRPMWAWRWLAAGCWCGPRLRKTRSTCDGH